MDTQNRLYKQYLLEKYFHEKIINEKNAKKRKGLYREAYNELYTFFRRNYPLKKTFGGTSQLVDLFKDLFRNRIVVDYGCGYGITTRQIAKYARKSIGVEISEEVVEKAIDSTRINNSNTNFYTVEKFNQIYKPASIDLFLSIQVAEHLHPQDLETHLYEAYIKLKKGGSYLLITPHRFNGPHDISKFFLPKGSTPLGLHLREYSYKEIASILKKINFRDTKALLTGYGIGIVRNRFCIPSKLLFIDISHKVLLENVLSKVFFTTKRLSKLFKLDSICIIAHKI